MILTNLTKRPVVLSDGTILAAAGRRGSTKEVEKLANRDRKRLVPRGAIHAHDDATTSPAVASKAARLMRSEDPDVRSVAGSALAQTEKEKK